MKKILICHILMLSLVIAFIPSAAGEISVADNLPVDEAFYNLMLKLNVVDAEDDLEQSVTRIQYAKMLYHLANADDSAASDLFTDVKSGDMQYASGVYYLGLMTGKGEGIFAPSDEITYNEVIATLVKLTGFEANAKALGGYPIGYLRVAADISLNRGVQSYENMSLANVLNILKRACDIDMQMVEQAIGERIIYERNRNLTILSLYHDIYFDNDVVSGNNVTSIYGDGSLCDRGEITIGKTKYLFLGDTFKYLGRHVNFYYKVNEDDEICEIVSISSNTRKNSEIVIGSKEFIGVYDSKVDYYENDRKISASLEVAYDLFYNNRLVIDDKQGYFDFDFGEITLIDNDGDDIYEVVFVTSVETARLSSISQTDYTIYFEMGFSQMQRSKVSIDYWDEHTMLEVFVSDSSNVYQSADIDELQIGQLLNVIVSADEKYVGIYANGATYQGVLEEIYDEELVIGGVKYEYVRHNLKLSLELGKTYMYMLDKFGRLAYIESVSGSISYGVLLGGGMERGLDSALKIKVVNAGGEEILECADKVKIDGETFKRGDNSVLNTKMFDSDKKVVKQLIKYTQNNDGKVINIDTSRDINEKSEDNNLSLDAKEGNMQYNNRMRSFNDRFKIVSNTFIIVTYDNLDDAQDIDDFKLTMNWAHEARYSVELYDVSDAGEIGAILVLDSKTIGSSELVATNPMGVYHSQFQGINSDGEIATGIRLYNRGRIESYYLSTKNFDKDTVLDLDFGDIVRFSPDNKGNILAFEVDFDVKDRTVRRPYVGNNFMLYGAIYAKGTETLAMIQGTVLPNEPIDISQRRIVPSAGGQYYLVDLKNNRVTPTDFNSLPGGLVQNQLEPHYIFTVTEYYGTLKYVFLFAE